MYTITTVIVVKLVQHNRQDGRTSQSPGLKHYHCNQNIDGGRVCCVLLVRGYDTYGVWATRIVAKSHV